MPAPLLPLLLLPPPLLTMVLLVQQLQLRWWCRLTLATLPRAATARSAP